MPTQFEQRSLILRHVDRCAGAFREIGDAAEVVPVPVRNQNRDAARLHPGELETQACCIATRIDDDSFGRSALSADDVAVRPDRAELVPVDDECHGAIECNGGYSLRIARVQSWNLQDIDTPRGSRSPVVLRSDPGARAVLIALEAGQALGDHETKEGVLITVLEGSVRVQSGGEAIDGGAGCLFSFDAD